MATNQLLPFASGESPNVLPFADWNSLPARLTGFQSGIASSQQFNYILAQGGSAGYVIGQLIADNTKQDATLDPESLYTNWKNAIAAFIPKNVADGSISGAKLTDNTVAFAKIASEAIATAAEAKAGTVNNKLMTPQLVAQAIAEQIPPAIPTGMLLPFAGTVVPEGFLLCNGAEVSRTDYANLFAAIGTKYGAGDGSTTFTLPNLDGRVLQGTTNTGNVGNYLEASLPNITGHFYSEMNGASGAFEYSGESSNNGSPNEPTSSSGKMNFNASWSNALYSDNDLQVSALQVLACIRI